MMRITKTISLALVLSVATSLFTAIPAAAAGVSTDKYTYSLSGKVGTQPKTVEFENDDGAQAPEVILVQANAEVKFTPKETMSASIRAYDPDGYYSGNLMWTIDNSEQAITTIEANKTATATLSGNFYGLNKPYYIFSFGSGSNTTDIIYKVSDGTSAPIPSPAPTPAVSTPATVPQTTPATSANNSSTLTFKSDTGANVTLGTNASYVFKITSLNGKKPSFSIPGKSFNVTPAGNKGADYFFKVTAVGKDGDSAGVYINGSKSPETVLSIKNTVTIDTGKTIKVQPGKTYQFKVTSPVKPEFSSGNSSVFKVTYNGNKGNNYFFIAKAVGKAGQGTGFYLNHSKTPVTVGVIG